MSEDERERHPHHHHVELPEPSTAPTPGRATATSRMPPSARSIAQALAVQAKGELDHPRVHEVAERGVAGAGDELPHNDAIQRAFGHHDVSGVRAHVGGAAAEASHAMGARAYATGDSVAFASAPDLHLAAHEAAHVVQQRGGVRLSGGVGRAGDPYEQHADAVADRVVRGESAEALLDPFSHRGSAGGPAVQYDFGDANHDGIITVEEAERRRDETLSRDFAGDGPRDWNQVARALGHEPPDQPQSISIPAARAPRPNPETVTTTETRGSGTFLDPEYRTPVTTHFDPMVRAQYAVQRITAFNQIIQRTEGLYNEVAPLVCAANDVTHDPTLESGTGDGFTEGSTGTLAEAAGDEPVSSPETLPASRSVRTDDLFEGDDVNLTEGERAGMRRASRSEEVEHDSTAAYASEAAISQSYAGIRTAQAELATALSAMRGQTFVHRAHESGRRAERATERVEGVRADQERLADIIDTTISITRRLGTAVATGGASEVASAAREVATDQASERLGSVGNVVATLRYGDELRAAQRRLDRALENQAHNLDAADAQALRTAQREVDAAHARVEEALAGLRRARVERRGAYDDLGNRVGRESGLTGRSRGRVEGAVRAIPRVQAVIDRYTQIIDACARMPGASSHPEAGEGYAAASLTPWGLTGAPTFHDALKALMIWRDRYTRLRTQWQHRLDSLHGAREGVRRE